MSTHTNRRSYTTIRNPQRRLRVLRIAGQYLTDRTGITDHDVADVTTRLARRGLAATDILVQEYADARRVSEGLDDGSLDVANYVDGPYYIPREALVDAVADDYRAIARRIERFIAGA